jgi:branched-chain amino acid transport system substrate-binding protein
VTIGLLSGTTGPDPAAGLDAVQGAQLAVNLVNGSYQDTPIPLASGAGLPRLPAARLTLVSADTKGVPDVATEQANSLVETRGATALIVSDAADVAAAAGSQTQRLRVPIVDARSTADYITELGMDWYFRTVPTDRSIVEDLFALIQRQLAGAGPVRLALFTEGGGHNAATAAVVRDLAAQAGYLMPVDHDLVEEPAQIDAYAAQMAATNCNIIIAVADTSPGASRAAHIAARLTSPLPLLGVGTGFAQARPPASRPVLLRTATWSAELAHRSPVARAVTQRYEHDFGRPMTPDAANAFTATMVLALAIDGAGSTDRTAIRRALRQVTVPATQIIMPWNGISFDANGQNELAAGVVEGWDSGFRVVYPRELSTGPMVWVAKNETAQ